MNWPGLILLFALMSCGQRDELDQLKNSDSTQNQDEVLESVQQNPYDLDDRLIMVASKKNGGDEGSVFFDSNYETPEKYHLELPQVIQASGSPGNGQKLYILFNSTLDCMWASEADQDYRNPTCFEGADRDPASPEGFSGGEEKEITSIEDVEKIQMHVNGAQGDGVLTTASAIFFKL